MKEILKKLIETYWKMLNIAKQTKENNRKKNIKIISNKWRRK